MFRDKSEHQRSGTGSTDFVFDISFIVREFMAQFSADGINGFLCEAGNADELASIITRLRQIPTDELQKISDAAVKTACELTDEKAAAYYLSQIVE